MQALTLQIAQAEKGSELSLKKASVPLQKPDAKQSSLEVSFRSLVEQETAKTNDTSAKTEAPQKKSPQSSQKESETKSDVKTENENTLSQSEKKPDEKEEKVSFNAAEDQGFIFQSSVQPENFQTDFSQEDFMALSQGENVSELQNAETIKQGDELLSENENISSELVALNPEEEEYLRKNSHSSVFEELLDNVAQYEPSEVEDEALLDSQTLSLEEPLAFLKDNAVKENLSEKKNLSSEKITDDLSLLEDDLLSDEKTFVKVPEEKVQQAGLFTLRDERTTLPTEAAEEKENLSDVKVNTEIIRTADNNVQMTLSLAENVNQNILASNDQSAAAAGSTFQEMLSQQIQHNAPDFVKAGNIVLRDNNQGTINMILKPEALGNVKVSLQLSDKVITGEITVQTKEAMEAFKENIQALRQAFVQSGYEDVQFNLNLAQNDSNGNFMQQGQQAEGEKFFLANRTYGDFAPGDSREDEGLTLEMEDFTRRLHDGIDMIA